MCSVSSGRAWLGAVRSGRACAVAAIGDGGCSYIAEGLSQNTTLHTIFLNGAPTTCSMRHAVQRTTCIIVRLAAHRRGPHAEHHTAHNLRNSQRCMPCALSSHPHTLSEMSALDGVCCPHDTCRISHGRRTHPRRRTAARRGDGAGVCVLSRAQDVADCML